MKKWIILLLAMYWITEASVLADEQLRRDDLVVRLALMDKISYHPNLLPVILRNSDYIRLTPEQLEGLNAWRKSNVRSMLSKMEEIAMGRIEFMEAAVNPSTMDHELQARQRALFKLQQEVLAYKLSCRRNIISIFTPEQWDNLHFLLIDSQQTSLK